MSLVIRIGILKIYVSDRLVGVGFYKFDLSIH